MATDKERSQGQRRGVRRPNLFVDDRRWTTNLDLLDDISTTTRSTRSSTWMTPSTSRARQPTATGCSSASASLSARSNSTVTRRQPEAVVVTPRSLLAGDAASRDGRLGDGNISHPRRGDAMTKAASGLSTTCRFIDDEMDYESGSGTDPYLDRPQHRADASDRHRGLPENRRLLERDNGDVRNCSIRCRSTSPASSGIRRRGSDSGRSSENSRRTTVASGSGRPRVPTAASRFGGDAALDDPETMPVGSRSGDRHQRRHPRRGPQGDVATSQTTDIAMNWPAGRLHEIHRADRDAYRTGTKSKSGTFEQHASSEATPSAISTGVLRTSSSTSTRRPGPIFETIRGSLREGGYLMIGMTETLPAECRDSFEAVDKRHRIYRRV